MFIIYSRILIYHTNVAVRRTRRMVKDMKGKPYEESAQPREETEDRPHCSLQLPFEGREGADTDVCGVQPRCGDQ